MSEIWTSVFLFYIIVLFCPLNPSFFFFLMIKIRSRNHWIWATSHHVNKNSMGSCLAGRGTATQAPLVKLQVTLLAPRWAQIRHSRVDADFWGIREDPTHVYVAFDIISLHQEHPSTFQKFLETHVSFGRTGRKSLESDHQRFNELSFGWITVTSGRWNRLRFSKGKYSS